MKLSASRSRNARKSFGGKDGCTGDIGHIDPEGYLQITDRLKDVTKSGGEWISSLTLEDILRQHESASEAAVIGVADGRWGERPLATAVLKRVDQGRVSERELVRFFAKFVENGTIPKFGAPSRIVFTDATPKTSVGKLDKKRMRKDCR